MALLQHTGRWWQRRGVPWILETNGILWREAAEDRRTHVLSAVARRVETDAYLRCDLVVAVSSELRDEVLDTAPITPSKVVVVRNGVDFERFPTDGVRAPRNSDLPAVGFVGAIYRWQGLDLLIEAVDRLRLDGTYLKVVIGGTGPELDQLVQRVRQLGLTDQVDFRGLVHPDQVPAFLASVDIAYSGQRPLANAPMYHSPLKLYEYVAACLPFVASGYPDATRLASLTGTGHLFSPDDVTSLVAALRQCLADLPKLRALAPAARSRLATTESWTARIAELLETIAEGRLLPGLKSELRPTGGDRRPC